METRLKYTRIRPPLASSSGSSERRIDGEDRGGAFHTRIMIKVPHDGGEGRVEVLVLLGEDGEEGN